MNSFVALITPLGGAPGGGLHPDHTLPVPPGPVDPGYSPPWARPGGPPHPDHSLPPFPSHPIIIPPDAVAPGVPTHPIYLPPYPDNALPGDQPHPDHTLPGAQPRPDHDLPPFPSHPIVYPPGLPGRPPTPGLPPLVPTHPIVINPTLPPGSALVVPLPNNKMAPPPGVPPNSQPGVIWYGPGTLPMVVWIPAIPATPK